MTTAPQTETVQDRLARARAALGDAERRASRWGGGIDRTALRTSGSLGGPTDLVPAPSARPASAAALSPVAEPSQESAAEATGERLPLPSPLAPLVPYGTLRAGSSVAVSGAASTSLLLSLAVAATGADGWCAIAGMPDLGLRAALDAGLDPCRLAIVPDAAEQTAQVLSALVDGVGVVVLGPHLRLAPALWRTLTSRARTRDALVLAADPPGRADLQLTVMAQGWDGLSMGSGRLRRRRVEVSAEGRGIAGARTAQLLLPEVRGMIAAAPHTVAAQAAAAHDAAVQTVARGGLQAVRRAG